MVVERNQKKSFKESKTLSTGKGQVNVNVQHELQRHDWGMEGTYAREVSWRRLASAIIRGQSSYGTLMRDECSRFGISSYALSGSACTAQKPSQCDQTRGGNVIRIRSKPGGPHVLIFGYVMVSDKQTRISNKRSRGVCGVELER